MLRLTDDYTLYLLVGASIAYVVHKLALPRALLHPLLLGRQAHVSQVRNPGESAIYRNYGLGASPLPTSPVRGVKTVLDLIRRESSQGTQERWLWGTKISNRVLYQRIEKVGAGLCSIAGLVPAGSRVLLLLNDSLEWLIADLALAHFSVPTITLTSGVLLNQVLESHPPNAIIVDASFLERVLELLVESSSDLVVVVVNDKKGELKRLKNETRSRLVPWEDLESFEGAGPSVAQPDASDVFSAAFYSLEAGELHGVQCTHENIVAGVTNTANLFPFLEPINEKDTVLSAFGLATPFGRSVAYTALYTGANFVTLPSTNTLKEDGLAKDQADVLSALNIPGQPAPTVLFLTNSHTESLTASILNHARRSWLFPLAWRHKQAALFEGSMSKDTYFDKQVFRAARLRALGALANSMREIAVAGPLDASVQIPLQIALSIPVSHIHIHVLSTSALLASHPYDLQIMSKDESSRRELWHYGPPTANVEIKLTNVNESAGEQGRDPEGLLCIRGPTMGDPVPSVGQPLEDGWVSGGERARVRANGTFLIEAKGRAIGL